MPLINARLSDKISGVMRHFFYHKYTLAKYVNVLDINGDPLIDDDGQPEFVLGTPVTNKPCLLIWNDQTVVNEGTETTLRTPVLQVPFDDDIEIGDIVENVLSRNNTTLLVSAKVETINPASQMGDPTVKLCVLSGAQVI